jgi:hypothetical protein
MPGSNRYSRASCRFGKVDIVADGSPHFEHYWEAFRWESEQIEQGRSPTDSPGAVAVIEAQRIVYTEHWLRRDGYAARQFWTRER